MFVRFRWYGEISERVSVVFVFFLSQCQVLGKFCAHFPSIRVLLSALRYKCVIYSRTHIHWNSQKNQKNSIYLLYGHVFFVSRLYIDSLSPAVSLRLCISLCFYQRREKKSLSLHLEHILFYSSIKLRVEFFKRIFFMLRSHLSNRWGKMHTTITRKEFSSTVQKILQPKGKEWDQKGRSSHCHDPAYRAVILI